MAKLLLGAIAAAAGLLAAGAAPAAPRLLTAAEWRADLGEFDAAIRTTHPRPFLRVREAEYAAAIAALRREIPRLDDHTIIVRMAAISALIEDGHTRLALPRVHPALGVEMGHARTEPPKAPGLAFAQLPLAFEPFEDGLFIVAAAAGLEDLIGAKLESVGGVPAAEALSRALGITEADNAFQRALHAADRLALYEALIALDLAEPGAPVPVSVSKDGRRKDISLAPLPVGDVAWRTAFDGGETPLRRRNAQKPLWSEHLPAEGRYDGALYAKIDVINDAPDVTLAAFVMAAVQEAEAKNAKLVIDLRDNFGGNGDRNRTLVLAIIESAELNQYGRTFVLTGRKTFSAAQLLANQLEAYTRTLFVGEPTGARPDHYGDASRIRLSNSGLTLRVSTLHWSSFFARDGREALFPEIDAPLASSDYFAGRDPALDRVRMFEGGALADFVGAALERGDTIQAFRHLVLAKYAPATFEEDISAPFLALGRSFEARARADLARQAYGAALYFEPGNRELEEALAALPPE